MRTTSDCDPRADDRVDRVDSDRKRMVRSSHPIDTRAEAASGGYGGPAHVQSATDPQYVVAMRIRHDDHIHEWVATRSLRILVVATEAPPVLSGIAREVGYMCDGLRERGHHVDVLAYPAIRRFVVGEVRLSSFVSTLPRLLHHVKDYDVIHIHGVTPTVSDIALLLARLEIHLWAKHPVVIYTHHMDLDFRPGGFLNRIYNYLHHRLSAHADVVVASTSGNLTELGDRCRGLVIPNAVDVEHFSTYGQKDPEFTVLFVGQFRPYKGVPLLLQAMSQVRGGRLLIAGHGPEEQAYRAYATKLGLDVEFHIGVSDAQLRRLYQRAHVVVLPSVSRAEAFGIVLVEGMAAGCVPVASDLPGVREVVEGTGFLFPVGDVNELARILCNLRDNTAMRQHMSSHAHIHAVTFGRERIISEYEYIIEGLVEVRVLRDRLAELSAHLDLPSLIASCDLRDRLVNEAESCALALHAFATNARYVTWDSNIDVTSLSPLQDARLPAAPTEHAIQDFH